MEKTKKEGKEVNHSMNRYVKIAIMLAILVVVAIISAYWAITNSPSPILEPRQLPFDGTNWDKRWFSLGDIEVFYTVKTVISTINVTLLVFLLIIYVDIYKKLKSEFTVGLILFSLILLLYAISSNPLLQSVFGFRAFGLGPFAMIPDIFTSLALAILLYLTLK
ncbi:hypothetical protein ACFLRN_07145 [Thermoproteota archaeon]